MSFKSLFGLKTHRGARLRNFAWTHVVAILVLLGAGVFSACSDMVVEPRVAQVGQASFDVGGGPCPEGMNSAQCLAVQDALEYLRNHEDPNCAAMGEAATDRFNAGDIHFDSSTSDYGYMYTGGSGTYLGSAAFNPGELANTIAHEESHHQGYEDLQDGSANDAYAMGDGCAGPI